MFRIVAMLFGLSMVFSGFAMADEENTESDSWKGNLDVTFAGWTEHLTSTGRNQDNYIVGFRYRQFEAFTLINSFDSRSYILAFHPQYEWKSWAKVGLRLGGISGYTQDENKIQAGGITPVVAPTLTLHYQHLGFETALFTDVLVFSLKVMI